MKITLVYDVFTKEKTVFHADPEVFVCENTDEGKIPARTRMKELQDNPFVVNLKFKIEDVPTRRVVKARYAPKGTIYHFEVNFDVKNHEGIEVDDLDYPGHRKYVFAVGKDYVATEEELAKEFDIRRLRPAYKAS